MSKPTRYTITIPAELDRELTGLSNETGVAVADLLRQGGIRVITEKIKTGAVALLKMPKTSREVAA
jgi:hypothetical protein